MALFLISYDLHKVRKYDDLYKVLEAWKAKRLLESLWLAELKGPTAAIMKILRNHIDADDSIPTNEFEEKAVRGLTEIEVSKHFAFHVMGLRNDMIEFYRITHNDDYAQYLDRCPGIFRSGLSGTAEFLQYKNAIAMREISLAAATKQNK